MIKFIPPKALEVYREALLTASLDSIRAIPANNLRSQTEFFGRHIVFLLLPSQTRTLPFDLGETIGWRVYRNPSTTDTLYVVDGIAMGLEEAAQSLYDSSVIERILND